MPGPLSSTGIYETSLRVLRVLRVSPHGSSRNNAEPVADRVGLAVLAEGQLEDVLAFRQRRQDHFADAELLLARLIGARRERDVQRCRRSFAGEQAPLPRETVAGQRHFNAQALRPAEPRIGRADVCQARARTATRSEQ